MKQKIFPFLIAFSALSVSASAAFYSISGLSKLFAGASLQVIIMASSLEVAKLVIASLLYQYWDSINKALRTYLVTAAVVLVLITSMGIYGYLSNAYQSTANKEGIVTQQITALETKKKLYEQTRDNIIKEKQSLADLKGTLSKGSVTQFTDKKGNLIVKSNNANVKQIESFTMSNLVVNFSSVLFADSICFTLALFDLTIRLPFLSVNWVTEPLDKVPFKSANDCFSLIMLSRVCSYSFFLVSKAVICCVTIPSLLAVD